MCGFAGLYAPGSTPQLPDSARALSHRGPDDHGSYQHTDLHLVHHRLSIRDTSAAGHQPMVGSTGQVLAYNGEIYNVEALATQLATEGVKLKGASDTEVVLEWLSLKGQSGIADLQGCFALALWNPVDARLLLARDPMGIKPLYIKEEEGTCSFASEVLGMGGDLGSWNAQGMADYLATGFTREGGELLSGVRSLLPGELLVFQHGKGKPHAVAPTFGAPKTLRDTVEEAVHCRLVSDVPLGAFLSGGLDSSIIAAVASKAVKNLHTFSLGFEMGGVLDERADAARVAEHLGTQHHEKVLSEAEMLDSMDAWIAALDLPFGDASALAVYHLSKFSRGHVAVALSGDGADEVFGGYRRHRAFLQAQNLSGPQRAVLTNRGLQKGLSGMGQSREGRLGLRIYSLCKFMGLASLPLQERYAFLTRFVQPEVVHQVFYHAPSQWPQPTNLSEMLLADQAGILPSDMLTKVDRMSMAHGLEVRVPFLDRHVVALGRSMPEKQLVCKGIGKWALRQAFAQDLPDSTIKKGKHGFEIPMERWLKGPLWENVQSVVHADAFDPQAGWNQKGIEELVTGYKEKSTPERTHLLWNLWVLKRWEAVHSDK